MPTTYQVTLSSAKPFPPPPDGPELPDGQVVINVDIKTLLAYVTSSALSLDTDPAVDTFTVKVPAILTIKGPVGDMTTLMQWAEAHQPPPDNIQGEDPQDGKGALKVRIEWP